MSAPEDMDYFALTSAQMGMWLANEVALNQANNNISEYLIIDGAINPSLFKDAIKTMIAETDAMHGRFFHENNDVRQSLTPVNDYEAGFYDFSMMDDPWATAIEYMTAQTNRAYSLSEKHLFTFFLVKIAENKHLYYQCSHHILTDGFGAALLLSRAIEIYNDLIAGEPVSPSPFGSFKTLMADDIEYRHSKRFARDRDYWVSRFSDLPEPVSLAGRAAPCDQLIRQRIPLEKPFHDAIMQRASDSGFTLPQLLTALSAIYLYRITGNEDLVIGFPMAARVGRAQRSIPGLMSNIMPLRLNLSPALTLNDVMAQAMKEMISSLRHQQYRHEDLLRELNVTRPLFNTAINVELFGESLALTGAETFSVNLSNGPVEDLSIFFFGYGGERTIVLGFDANSALYSEQQLLTHYERMTALFSELIANPEMAIGVPALLSASEQQQIALLNDKTAAPIPSLTLAECFEKQVQLTPDAPAIFYEESVLSYGQLNSLVNQMSHYLRQQGVRPGDIVGLLLPRTDNLVIAMLAIMKAGAVYMPLDPDHPAERIKHILATAAPTCLLTTAETSALVAQFPQYQIDDNAIIAGIISQPETDPVTTPAQRQQAAYVLFTSGSTGAPKGVLIPHHALTNFMLAMQQHVLLSAEHRLMAVTTVGFDIAALELFLPLLNGAAVVIASRDAARDPHLLANEIHRWNITHLQGTPALWQGLVSYQPQALTGLTALVGGDALAANLAEQMVTLASRVIQVYGPTETTIWSTLRELTADRVAPSIIGLPINNTQVYILDSALQPVPVGQAGELYIAGDGLAFGYLKRADLTSERFVANPFGPEGSRMYRTGDIAFWEQDMQIGFLGRADNQVKIRGYRIELGDIENALLGSKAIKQALVLAHDEKASGQKRLVAYVVPHDGAHCSPDTLRAELGKQLPDYMVPSVMMVLEQFPLTANGKIDRRALPVPAFTAPARVLPSTPQQEKLCQLFAECLDSALPGIDDNFFSLGGHSLLALKLLSRIREAFNSEISLKAIFDAPTVAELSRLIEAGSGAPVRPALVAQPRPALLPMSFAQQRLWLQEQIAPGSAYNMPLAIRLNGKLDAAMLTQALADVIARHESLRTRLTQQEDTPCQQVLTPQEAAFTLQQQAIAPDDLNAQLMQHSAHIFALDRELPIKGWLYQLAPEQHVLLLVIHHTAGDGGSLFPLLQDLSLCWQARQAGHAPDLAPLAVQYADYALWQRALLSEEQDENALFARQMAYWRNQLQGLPEEITLAGDRPRPARASYAGDRVAFTLPDGVFAKLAALSAQTGASLFMLLHAGLVALLHRMGAGDDIAIGTPIYGRTDIAQIPMIGYFANTAVLRTQASGNPELRTLIELARSAVLEANEHQDLPFERLVEALAPDRSLAKHPLFQVMLAVDTPWPQAVSFEGLQLEQLELPTSSAKFDLLFNFNIDEQHGRVSGHIEYATELYNARTIEGVAERVVHVIETLVNAPTTRVGELALLTSAQRETLLSGWNATRVALPEVRLAALFEQQVLRTPDAIAVKQGSKTVTYSQLNQAANRLAHRLIALNGGKSFCAGLLMQHSIDEVIATLAVIKAGGAYLPLRPRDPLERQQMMLDDAGATLLIADAGLPLPDAAHIIHPADDAQQAGTETNPAVASSAQNLAYIMYTSGSTGKPKGIAINQQSVAALALDRRWSAEDHQRVLLHSPSAFDASTYELWVPLLCGGQLIVAPAGELDIDALAQIVMAENVTALWLTAGLFRLMAEEHASALKAVRLLIAGGDVLPVAAIRKVMTQCPELKMMNGYGPTETTTFTTTHLMPGIPTETTVPIGAPIDNMQTYVLDGYLNPVPVGVPGELYIAGLGLARGYQNQPVLTATHFVANPFTQPGERMYRSGDWARWREDGVLEYLSRGDQQVKIRGFRIELAEVETALQQQPAVAQALACIVEPNAGNKQIVAYVIPRKAVDFDAEQLRAALSAQLPDFMVPAMIIPLQTFPLNANGKVDMRALPAPHFTAAQHRGARNERESMLCALFAEVLGLDDIGIDDNFFALGGHSLLASRLVSKVRREMRVDPAIRDLFEAPTVAQFAERLHAAAPSRLLLQAREKPARLPLSAAQRRLWMIDRIEGQTATYNMPLTLELTGEVNVAALAAALNDVKLRHETLRTRFLQQPDGSVYQHVTGDEEAACALITEHVASDDLQSRMLSAAQYTFDLAGEDPCRTWLFTVNEERHLLLFLMHHIASDGSSLSPLLHDLAAAYNARAQGQAPAFTPLTVNYGDYALWQNDWLGEINATESLANRQLAWWRNTLADLPDELKLPLDRPRPARASYQGKQCRFIIDESLHARLLEVAKGHNASLFMVLQAALAVLLHRMGAGDDIPVGTAIAGRSDEALEPLVGFFINTLVMRATIDDNLTFSALLEKVRDYALQAYEHQDLPFDNLVEALNPERSLARHPLFQVMLVLQNMAYSEARFDHLQTRVATPLLPVAKFDLTFNIEETPTALNGILEYATDLFDDATAEALAERFVLVLNAVMAEPQRRVGSVPLLLAEECQAAVQACTAFNQWAHATLHQVFEQRVRETPQATALSLGDKTMSYGELNQRANQLARYLVSRGIGTEDSVALALPRTMETLVALLAIVKAGAAYLPLDVHNPADRLAYIVDDARPALIITLAEYAGTLSSTLPELLLDTPQCQQQLAGLSADDLSDNERLRPVTPESLVYIIYTSGSTGKPKGVMIHHSNVLRLFAATEGWFDFARTDIWTLFHSCSFDFSVWEIWGPLLYGGELVVVPFIVSRDPQAFLQLLSDKRVTILNQTPSAFYQLIEAENAVAPASYPLALRKVVFGGEALDLSQLERWYQRHDDAAPELINMYGITETTVHVSYQPLTAEGARNASGSLIGVAIPDLHIHLLDNALQPVPPGVEGEMYISGAGLARGYLNRVALSSERFVADPYGEPGTRMYRSGDVAIRTRKGELNYLGRADQQVKLRGFRIELGEIAAALASYPQVTQAEVILQNDNPGNPQLVGYIISDGSSPVDMTALRHHAADKLPEYMVPAAIVQMEKFPLTINGKLDKRALPKPSMMQSATRRQPRNAQEEMLAGLFAEVLQLDAPGIDDNFFMLGGHSLLAMRLISRISSELGKNVPIRTLFDYPTVAQLASQLAQADIAPKVALTPQPRGEYLPLSFAQQRMWLLKNLDDNHAAYNMPLAVRFSGPLNEAALGQALRDVVARHEVLRTLYPLHQEQPYQHILAADSVEMTLSVKSVTEEALAGALDEASTYAFDLAREIPLRCTLFRLPQTHEQVLLIVIHHIACDGGSLAPLFHDISCAYNARCQQQVPTWTPLAVQYADYALWQRSLLGEIEENTPLCAQQIAFWRSALADAPEEMLLPVDRPHPASPSYVGERVHFRIDEALYQRIKTLTQQEGVTPFMLLQATAAILFSRMGAGDDITLGTAAAGRSDEAIGDLVGFFVNTLVLRVDLAANPSFRAALASVREYMLSAYVNQDVPFDWVVKALNPGRSSARHPLFQVMMVLQNNANTPPQLVDVQAAHQPVGLVTTKFDLLFNFDEISGENGEVCALDAQIDFPVELFDRSTVTALAGYFVQLLQAAVDAPDRPVKNLPLLSGEQRDALIHIGNDTVVDLPPATLAQEFACQVAKTPHHIAISCGDEQLTYQELDARANALAHSLQQQGVKAEQGVALLLERSLSLVIGVLAVVKAGGFYVPLRTSDPFERWQHITHTLDVRIAVVDEQHSATPLPEGIAVLTVNNAHTQEEAPTIATPLKPDHIAYVMFTSGSTGQPKGIAITQDNVVALARDRRWQGEHHQRILLHSPYAFDASTYEIWAALLNGHQAVIVPGEALDLPVITSTITDRNVTAVFLTSGLFRLIAEEAWQCLAGVSKVYTGGEKISPSAVQSVREHLPDLELMNIYGPTETTTYATDYPITQADAPYLDVPIGYAMDNTCLYVLDEYLQPQPEGVAGELYIAGRGLARGYVNHPGLSAAHFVADPYGPAGSRMYRTGDRVKRRRDGAISFVSRGDQQVKIRGFRIEPGEIEIVLKQHKAVQQVAVIPLEDAAGHKQLVAYVVASDAPPALPEALQQFARERLPDFMVPAAVVLLEALPLNANGKLAIRSLPKPDFSTQAGRQPQSEREIWLAEKFSTLLKVENVSIDSSFFAMGGHSLLAARLITQIDRELQVKLTIRDLFESPTVAMLAQRLESNRRSSMLDVMLPLQPLGDKAALFCLPPGGGLSWSYSGLIGYLGEQQPIYGLQASRISTGEAAASVEALAKTYLAEIYKVQPEGPYALLGWSFGCHLAHEVATLLQKEGHQVSTLVLLDGYPLGERYLETIMSDEEGLKVLFEALVGAVPDDQALFSVEGLRRELQVMEHPLADVAPVIFERIFAELRDAPLLLAATTPGCYRGDMLFFKATQRDAGEEDFDPQLWANYVDGNIIVHPVPGTHNGMFSPEALKSIGPVIQRWLESH
ncbi:non-ribosomal peptide synthetase [Kosakonia cowanii]|uniref:non-ribosomal peptide synthetase n=1 Tax=Kosakonia cowanii TaxID=208223 RepID=UPI0029829508|nr:non-ribosomal peptide synthetase [Kosakonia cowanii]